MADKKVVFIAFAIEDVKQRDLLKGQSLNTKSPFEYMGSAHETENIAR